MIHAKPRDIDAHEGLECMEIEIRSRSTAPDLSHPFLLYVTRKDGITLEIACMTLADVALFVIETSPSAVSCRGTHDEVEALHALTTEPCGTIQ